MYKVIRCVCIYTICKIIFIKVSVHSAAVWAGMAPNKACQGFKMAISFRFDTMIRIILPSSITFTWIFGRILPPHPLSHQSLFFRQILASHSSWIMRFYRQSTTQIHNYPADNTFLLDTCILNQRVELRRLRSIFTAHSANKAVLLMFQKKECFLFPIEFART